jgi:hypothetical protein
MKPCVVVARTDELACWDLSTQAPHRKRLR